MSSSMFEGFEGSGGAGSGPATLGDESFGAVEGVIVEERGSNEGVEEVRFSDLLTFADSAVSSSS